MSVQRCKCMILARLDTRFGLALYGQTAGQLAKRVTVPYSASLQRAPMLVMSVANRAASDHISGRTSPSQSDSRMVWSVSGCPLSGRARPLAGKVQTRNGQLEER